MAFQGLGILAGLQKKLLNTVQQVSLLDLLVPVLQIGNVCQCQDQNQQAQPVKCDLDIEHAEFKLFLVYDISKRIHHRRDKLNGDLALADRVITSFMLAQAVERMGKDNHNHNGRRAQEKLEDPVAPLFCLYLL
jgi:hypothetical protein